MKDNIIAVIAIIVVGLIVLLNVSNCVAGDKYKGSEARWQELSAKIR